MWGCYPAFGEIEDFALYQCDDADLISKDEEAVLLAIVIWKNEIRIRHENSC